MTAFSPRNPGFSDDVRASFARQRLMGTLGAQIVHLAPGEVDISMSFDSDFTQQHGYLHAGIVTALADTACGYAAQTLMEPGVGVLSVEFKVNLLAPTVGREVLARGRVKRSGRTITVCTADVVAIRDGEEQTVALMQATMMAIRGREELPV